MAISYKFWRKVEVVCAVELGAVLAVSAALKLWSMDDGVPEASGLAVELLDNKWAVASVALFEFVLAACLLLRRSRAVAMAVCGVVLAVMSLIVAKDAVAGEVAGCGCFGSNIDLSPDAHLATNGVLILLAGAGLRGASERVRA